MKWWYLPFVLQGLCMVVDEFYFHEKRGLKRWERLGHPLDSLVTLLCFLCLIIFPIELPWYVGLCAFSCLFITKDEFVHALECRPAEQWLHAVLFILHPLVFFSAWFLWQEQDYSFISTQAIIITLFMFYQLLRWSFPWQKIIK